MSQRRSIAQALSTKEIDFLKQPLRQTASKAEIPQAPKLNKHEATAPAQEPNIDVAVPKKQGKKSIEQTSPIPVSEQWVPLSTRVPKSLHRRLKRVALERQEQNVTPNSIQDMIVEATKGWLRTQK